MSKKVYGLWLGKTHEAFYQLSKEEQEEMMKKRNQNLAEVGGKDVFGYTAFASEWEMFGMVEYPNVGAQMEHELFCDSIGWKRYFTVKVISGIQSDE